jgi:hypothetical protein
MSSALPDAASRHPQLALHGAGDRVMTADQLEDGKPGLVADNRLPIDQAASEREACPRPLR